MQLLLPAHFRKKICEKHGALLIEDAAEALGASLHGKPCGSFGDYSAVSYNGNKIITGSSGGMLLTDDAEKANKARKWSTQSRENAEWYQHEDLGYNYRMSNVIAGVVRGQLPYLEEHIAQKKAIYMRYKEGLKDLPVSMNPYDEKIVEPNFWLSCFTINADGKAHIFNITSNDVVLKDITFKGGYAYEGGAIYGSVSMERNRGDVNFSGNYATTTTSTWEQVRALCDEGMHFETASVCIPASYVKQAKEKGIAVCYQTVDGVAGSERLCFLGTDYVEYGKIMMQQAAEATGGKGDVIVVNALSAGSSSVEAVMQGIREEVENWPDMKIVAEVDDQSDAAVAATKIGAALLANPDTTVVIGGQSTSAIGAVTAIKEAGLSDSVSVISIDRDAATLEYIQSGDIYSTVAGKQYTEVYYGVHFCYDYKHGAKNAFSADDAAAGMVIAPSFVDTGALIINAANVEKFVGFSYADRG